jgi:aminoglycoside phosphotransferase (APT) family kinase protein
MPSQKMHADEWDVHPDLVRRLLDTQFPEWSDLALGRVPSAGTDNALYRLGDDMVVRLPRIQWAVEDVAKELRWLPTLQPFLPVSIPLPLGEGRPGEGYPWAWSVLQWLPGENPILGDLADPNSLAKELAQFVAALHQIDPTGGPRAERGVPLAERDAATRAAIGQLRGMIDIPATIVAWQEALQAPEWLRPGVWIHGDLSPGNLLLVDGRLSGVIDFGALGVGDPACDLIVAWNLLPAGAREVYREALKVDDATWARGLGWALSVALIQLPYYKETNPSLAANARHVIGEVLADHSSGRCCGSVPGQ